MKIPLLTVHGTIVLGKTDPIQKVRLVGVELHMTFLPVVRNLTQ